MIKKISIILVIATLGLSTVACNNGSGGNGSSAPKNTVTPGGSSGGITKLPSGVYSLRYDNVRSSNSKVEVVNACKQEFTQITDNVVSIGGDSNEEQIIRGQRTNFPYKVNFTKNQCFNISGFLEHIDGVGDLNAQITWDNCKLFDNGTVSFDAKLEFHVKDVGIIDCFADGKIT